MSTYRDIYARFFAENHQGEKTLVHSWADHTARNLAWHYGPERAAAIMAGEDEATNADIAAWQRLGMAGSADLTATVQDEGRIAG